VGVRLVAGLVAALVLAAGAAAATRPVEASAAYLVSAQRSDGGFAEVGSQPDPTLTAWAALGLVAAGGGSQDARSRALGYLRAHEAGAKQVTDVALAALARLALGDRPETLLARLRAVRPGGALNGEVWTILALRAAGESPPPGLVGDLLSAQAHSGGWSWARGSLADSNDTAAVIEALRAAGVGGSPVARGIAALTSFRNSDGGYGLARGRASDAQSTAWAIQAILAAGRKPARATWRFLARLRRPDGSYRYTLRYGTTPVWVTAQVLPAIAGKPFPLASG
jgi:hypothetical protein